MNKYNTKQVSLDNDILEEFRDCIKEINKTEKIKLKSKTAIELLLLKFIEENKEKCLIESNCNLY